jgi:hypothetical protein
MLFKSHNSSPWVDLALKWCKKKFYKKILVLEIVQEKKFTLLHFECIGLMIRLLLPPPMKGRDFKPHGVKPKEKC